MKQTAVEWLYDQLEFDDSISMDNIHDIFEQAKEMEKEQICKAYTMGVSPMLSIWRYGEDYYNETFKSE